MYQSFLILPGHSHLFTHSLLHSFSFGDFMDWSPETGLVTEAETGPVVVSRPYLTIAEILAWGREEVSV